MVCNHKCAIVILEPTDKDILYGRDGSSILHIGNVAFRTLIGCCIDEHKEVPKSERSRKHTFLVAIVRLIVRSGGRFLKRQKNGKWEAVSIEAARKKVGQELRDESRNPHILFAFSLTNTSCIEYYFKSAFDFDWSEIVRSCKRELTKSKNVMSDVNAENDAFFGSLLDDDFLTKRYVKDGLYDSFSSFSDKR